MSNEMNKNHPTDIDKEDPTVEQDHHQAANMQGTSTTTTTTFTDRDQDLEAGDVESPTATSHPTTSNNNNNNDASLSSPCSQSSNPARRCVTFCQTSSNDNNNNPKDKAVDSATPPASSSSSDDDDEEKGKEVVVVDANTTRRPALHRRSSSLESQRALQSFRQSLSRIDAMHGMGGASGGGGGGGQAFFRQSSSSRSGFGGGRPVVDGGPMAGAASSSRSMTMKAQEEENNNNNRWRPWKSWSSLRLRTTSYGVLSSIAVLAVRLYLDSKPMVYLIHSIVVFLDMVLIHIFTNSPWLSVAGEIVTMLCVLGFTVTKETLFELLETTLIAVLCSFHLIMSRNKHWDHEKSLETDMEDLRATSLHLLRHLDEVDGQDIAEHFADTEYLHEHDGDTSSVDTVGENTEALFGYQHDHEACKQKLKLCGENFFEHFLDGSAGVMYTSFLGLIISELLTYGQDKDY